MKQDNLVRIYSEDKKIYIICESDTTLGSLHDFLLQVKGNVVERMEKAHKEEIELAKKQAEEEKQNEEKK